MANVECLVADLAAECARQYRGRGKRRTHCRSGHLYDDENTYYWKSQSGKVVRFCKACREDDQELRHREGELRRRYGITPADYDTLLEQQEGRCAICRGAPTKSYRSFDVDHDHETDRVRGLLCRRCNVGLGYLEDNEYRDAALTYLTKETATWPA